MSTIVVLTIFTFLAFVHHVAFSSRLRFAHLKVAIMIIRSRRGCCCSWQGRVSEVVVGLFVLLGWRQWPFSLVDCQDSYEILCCIFVCLSLGPGAVIIRISSFAVASVAAIFWGRKKKNNLDFCIWRDRVEEHTIKIMFFDFEEIFFVQPTSSMRV